MPTAGFVVSGHVQGVGFRLFVVGIAQGLNITGQVWNRRDGAVEVVATHPDEAILSEFGQALWKGPGRVESVSRHPSGDDSHSDFEIGPSR